MRLHSRNVCQISERFENSKTNFSASRFCDISHYYVLLDYETTTCRTSPDMSLTKLSQIILRAAPKAFNQKHITWLYCNHHFKSRFEVMITISPCYEIAGDYSTLHNIHGLAQERRNSGALAMELRLSRTNPSIWWDNITTKIYNNESDPLWRYSKWLHSRQRRTEY